MGISLGCISSGRGLEYRWQRREYLGYIFCKIPGTTYKNTNGDIAVDHYKQFKKDVSLMKEMGLKAYRFSIAWSMVYIPER